MLNTQQLATNNYNHQYIDRKTGTVKDEILFGDKTVNLVYSEIRENASWLFNALTSSKSSRLLSHFNYDIPIGRWLWQSGKTIKDMGIDTSECYFPDGTSFRSLRDVFERKIRYWETRPMDDSMAAVVSPCDAKLLPGYFEKNTSLSIKGKFFDFEELISKKKHLWKYTFNNGTFGVFRLTPEKYHYNHAPVSGYVADHYEIDGSYHSCNPSAVVKSVTPFSKNKRVVTIFNTDVKGGSNIGYVAMIEIVALMIGDISQRYCSKKYDSPQRIVPGLFVEKGQPKSLFRPGSSTVVLMFEKNRFRFSKDIVQNAVRKNVFSRYSRGFGTQLVETDIDVRSTIGFSEEKYAPTFKKGN